LSDFTYPLTSAAWAPDGESFATASQDTEHALIKWDMSYEKIYHWKEDNLRVNDIAISPDGNRLVVVLESRIFVYNYKTHQKLSDWRLDDVKLTSVKIHQDSKSMLISMNTSKIHLMKIDNGDVLQTFSGHTQAEYIIRSSFGGANETFVVSGSEGKSGYPKA
jgi:WD repeat-containing protein 26